MSIRSQKSGSSFGTVTKSGVLTPEEIGALIFKACGQVGISPSVEIISQGIGTVMAESGGDPKNPGNGLHKGLWMEDSSFGPSSVRLDAYRSTVAALQQYKADGNTFAKAWWAYEHGETEGTGGERASQYVKTAEKVILSGLHGIAPTGGPEINPVGIAKSVWNDVTTAEQFLQKMGETLLDFKSLGQLAVEAFAWFIRLLAKAIWDYVIAPMVHWGERAVSFYWINYFGTGVEQGSGFGYQLRQNAGTITILFWAMGYAILWTDGSSATPVIAHETMLGQGVKKVDGTIARRNLVKPKDVKKKTPTKPKPTASRVPIQQKETFRVGRNRPVRVEPHSEGRKRIVSNRRQAGDFKPTQVPRPGQNPTGEQSQKPKPQIILPPGTQIAPKQSRPRVGPRSNRNGGA